MGDEPGKLDEGEEKKLSNRTTAEVSANITFDVYDPVSLKKSHFSKTIVPRVADLKSVLFGQVQASSRARQAEQAKPLKSISEFNESSKEDERSGKAQVQQEAPQVQEMKTFVVQRRGAAQETEVPTPKEFVIGFEDLVEGGETSSEEPPKEESEHVEIQINEDIEKAPPRPANPFWALQKAEELRLKTNTLNFSNNSTGSGTLYDQVNQANRFRVSVRSNSSGYSKENLVLDLTPDKPKCSSIDYLNSSGKNQAHSDFKSLKPQLAGLDQSVNSRPSFLDRKPYRYRHSETGDRHWECLSINTTDLLNSEALSEVSDVERQALLEEAADLVADRERKVLLVELLREKPPAEAQLMLSVLRKLPWVFDETLRRRREELLQRKKERKEKRLLRSESGWQSGLKKGGADKRR